jgi:hypothetical protein
MNSTAAAPVSQKAETKARIANPPDAGLTGYPPDAGLTGYPPDAGDECPLPTLPLLVWEQDRDGGWEAWHAPDGKRTPRKLKTYLGRWGKRKLAELARVPESERLDTVAEWVAERRREKGLG